MAITIEQARAWYHESDPVHDFEHVLRVYQMAERLARVEGADLEILRAAALLHDAQGSAPGSAARSSHHQRSAGFAQQVLELDGWDEARIEQVLHCIRAHRFRSDGETPKTIEAKLLFDSDKLDVLGAIGVARVIGYAAINNQPFYTLPSERFFRTGQKETGEPHSAYHEFIYKLIHIRERLFSESAKAVALEREQYLAGYFTRLQREYTGDL